MSTSAAYVCRQFVEDVTAYLDDALTIDLMRLIDAHLVDCPHCREYLGQMRRTIRATRSLGDADIAAMPADLRERLTRAFRQLPD